MLRRSGVLILINKYPRGGEGQERLKARFLILPSNPAKSFVSFAAELFETGIQVRLSWFYKYQWSKIRSNVANRNKLSEALSTTFICAHINTELKWSAVWGRLTHTLIFVWKKLNNILWYISVTFLLKVTMNFQNVNSWRISVFRRQERWTSEQQREEAHSATVFSISLGMVLSTPLIDRHYYSL